MSEPRRLMFTSLSQQAGEFVHMALRDKQLPRGLVPAIPMSMIVKFARDAGHWGRMALSNMNETQKAKMRGKR